MLSAPQASAAANEIVNGGPAPSPAEAAAAAADIVDGATSPSLPAAAPNATTAGPAADAGATASAVTSSAVDVGLKARVHQLAAAKVAAKSVTLRAPASQRHHVLKDEEPHKHQQLAVAHAKQAPHTTNAFLSKIGINTGETNNGMVASGDVLVKAPHGGVAVGQIFRANPRTAALKNMASKGTQKLAMTYPGTPATVPSNYYAAGIGAPVNTDPNLPPVTFISGMSYIYRSIYEWIDRPICLSVCAHAQFHLLR